MEGKSAYIVADNSRGKTNFLEAVFYSVYGSSFKMMLSSSEVIKEGSDFAKVEILFENMTLKSVISKKGNSVSKRHFINDKLTRVKTLPAKFPIIIFAPQSVDLVSGSPDIRRKDLDSFLSACDSSYSGFLAKYMSILKNRNAVLKNIRDNSGDKNDLTFWTDSLIAEAKNIFEIRLNFFKDIHSPANLFAKKLFANCHSFNILYQPFRFNLDGEIPYETFLKNKISENIEKEIRAGQSLYGIHKDDYTFVFNQKDLRFFGSRGQQRLATFVYKMSQMLYLNKNNTKKVILLLDDLFSELDDTHRNNVAQILLDSKTQFLITSADVDEVPLIIKDNLDAIPLI